MASDLLPPELKKAFFNAVVSLRLDCDRETPDRPLITLDGKAHSIREICLLVWHECQEQLPEELKEELSNQMQNPQYEHLRDRFDGCYASAARCLLQLMYGRLEDKRRVDNLRRDRI
jgi:hypothetical protein